MDEPGALIPDLERLARDVLRTVFEGTMGAKWRDQVGTKASAAIAKAATLAKAQRPTEVLRDDWEAAGIGEISTILKSNWSKVSGALAAVWPSLEHAKVDLDRLRRFRGKALHQVGAPAGPGEAEELAGLITRLRTGFEAIRRDIAGAASEWWPYIEAVHSNIPGFSRVRGSETMTVVDLFERDLVSFDIRAVHPTAEQHHLRFKVSLAGLPSPHEVGWSERNRLELPVIAARSLAFHVFVADARDLHNADEWVFPCRARAQ